METFQVDNRIYYHEGIFGVPGYHWVNSSAKKASWLIFVRFINNCYEYFPLAYIRKSDDEWYEVHQLLNIGGSHNNTNTLSIKYRICLLDFSLQEAQDIVLQAEEYCSKNSLENSLRRLSELNFELDNIEFPGLELLYDSRKTIIPNTLIRSYSSDRIYTGTTEDGLRTYIFLNTAGSIPAGDIGRVMDPIGFVDNSENGNILVLNIVLGQFCVTIKGSANCLSIEDSVKTYLAIMSTNNYLKALSYISSNEFEILPEFLDINVGWRY